MVCKKLGLNGKFAHTDSTDFHVEGQYNSSLSEVDERVVHLLPGYSRDHRPDCNQVVLNLMVENQAEIAIHMQALDGNSSDKTAFKETISTHIGNLQQVHEIEYIVMDSAGYTEETLVHGGSEIKWISRVPETLKIAKEVVGGSYEKWEPLSEGYQYIPLERKYAGIDQRWLLIFSAAAYEREMLTLRKNYQKNSLEEAH